MQATTQTARVIYNSDNARASAVQSGKDVHNEDNSKLHNEFLRHALFCTSTLFFSPPFLKNYTSKDNATCLVNTDNITFLSRRVVFTPNYTTYLNFMQALVQ